MIRDILMCLLCPTPGPIPIAKYVEDESAPHIFHPNELAMLREVIGLIEKHGSIKAFVKKFSCQIGIKTEQNSGPHGLYLSALANSIDAALNPFRQHLVDLERKYLGNTDLSLGYMLTEIKQYEMVLDFIIQMLNDVQNYHGCAILKLLHKHAIHADPNVMEAIKTIRKGVYAIFLRQLSQWLIHGEIIDIYEEFFIIHIDANKKQQQNASGTIAFSGFLSTTDTSLTDTNINADYWQYHIVYDMLPANFSPAWAEKVLFVGQTVRMLKPDARKTSTKKISIWDTDDEDDENSDYVMDIGSVWNKQEHVYLNRIQTLYNADSIDVGAYERVVHEIKTYVTSRLSEIAVNQADLIKHLRLVKEYFLLGRGEFFLEFIIQTEPIKTMRKEINDRVARDLHQAFQTALNRTFTDLEQITIHLPLDEINGFTTDFDDDPKLFLRLVRLKFNVKWPLHMFFSPTIIDRYNQLFRFLLQIRRAQNDLHTVWRMHREQKVAGNLIISQLRNRMLFFIDNLQYYLQADVLESQYSILINAIQNCKDFEFIQRSHSIFQANIMSLCFLLNGSTNDNVNKSKSAPADNPVLFILHKIMKTIRTFCTLNEDCANSVNDLTKDEMKLLMLNEKLFAENIEDLMTLLSNRMAGPTSEPLSQLLLRLDFNYWFSNKQMRE